MGSDRYNVVSGAVQVENVVCVEPNSNQVTVIINLTNDLDYYSSDAWNFVPSNNQEKRRQIGISYLKDCTAASSQNI